MTTGQAHQPVLKDEALESLRVSSDGIYIDGTFGRGGHSQAILERLDERGQLLVVDADPEAIECAKQVFGGDPRVAICHANFDRLRDICRDRELLGRVDGLLLDLGVSSPQLDRAERGFSFSQEGPLDMRMDPTTGISAREWLARVSEEELADVLWRYGEERYSRRIAKALVRHRDQQPLLTTTELAEAVKTAHPRWERHRHPATRAFQAIRIHINRELDALKSALEALVDLLKVGGRFVVISFHSLEDRLVKRFARGDLARTPVPRGLPIPSAEDAWPLRLCGGTVRPCEDELARNPRARSAVMRVVERLA